MISTFQLTFIFVLICGILILRFVKNKKWRKITLAVGIVFSVFALTGASFYKFNYYFNYEKFYNEFEKTKVFYPDNFLLAPELVSESTEDIKYYHYDAWHGAGIRMAVSFKLTPEVYDKWKSQQTIQIDDFLLEEGEGISSLGNKAFNTYCRSWVSNVAANDLSSIHYYFLRFTHADNLVYGVILNDETNEVIQFYFR